MVITICDHNIGLLGMVLQPSDFNTLTRRNPFAPPIDPGPSPINSICTSAKNFEATHLYKHGKENFTTYCKFYFILISIITNKCPENYMTTLKHRIIKFCQCEPLTLIFHSYTDYGTITSSDLTANFDRMTAYWNSPTPIFDIFQQLNDGKDFEKEEGNETINDSQLICLCYDNMYASGLFNKTHKNWRKQTDIGKTYANFVPFMTQQE